MIRVGFRIFSGDSWLGGLNYVRNLIEVLLDGATDQVTPVLFLDAAIPAPEAAPFDSHPNLQIIRIAGLDGSGRLQTSVRALITGCDKLAAKAFLKYKVDVAFESQGYLGSRFPLPTLSWFPDFQHRRMRRMFRRPEIFYRDTMLAARLRAGRTIMLSSQSAQTDCHLFFPKSKGHTVVVPFAIQPRNLPQAEPPNVTRDRYRLPDNYFFLPNQLWKHKNHGLVVEALSLLKERGIDVTVASTGAQIDLRDPGYFRSLLAGVNAGQLSENLRFFGVVPYSDVIGLLRASSALINPSRFEGWSTSVEEAKCYGVPLLLSDIDVHREQAGSDAAYFPMDDAHKLADLLAIHHQKASPESRSTIEALALEKQRARVAQFTNSFVNAVKKTRQYAAEK